MTTAAVQYDFSLLTEDDLHLFNEGTHFRLYQKLGSHLVQDGSRNGVYFAVWAPNARDVSVTGDFNSWVPGRHSLRQRGVSGIWEGFIPDIGRGTVYKYHIVSHHNGYQVQKADPCALLAETPPKTASTVWGLDYEWGDGEWMGRRAAANALDAPISIYEVHIGSWRRLPDPLPQSPLPLGEGQGEGRDRPLTYREMAPALAEHVQKTGFTHVEFLPVMEHPFYGSWGYQTTGYFAPTSRYGTPQDFMYLVDYLHQHGIGVILDWVPSHFPNDEHSLGYFDGTHLFEHADARLGFHPDWNSYIFNYGRNEVRSFLLSSGLFWLDQYHADGLRVDAVASMLYLDYSRKAGEWIPNRFGGRENLEAISFLRQFNQAVYERHPDVQTYAEESTAWPMVSRPNYVGGLGFGLKWDMGWMHDTLDYISKAPIHRKYHHGELTFRMIYAFNENFVLPLSHDEVVHGKGSLLNKLPGDDWQRFANLRLLFGYMYSQPGKKLLLMGSEFGQWREWDHESGLDWRLLDYQRHRQLQRWVSDLNALYRAEPALHRGDTTPQGFEWIDANDADNSILTYLRKPPPSHSERSEESRRGAAGGGDVAQAPSPVRGGDGDIIAVVCNFTPVPRNAYRVGVPRAGFWRELLNGDAETYGGSGQGNYGGVEAEPVPSHGRPHSITITAPPLSVVFLKSEANT